MRESPEGKRRKEGGGLKESWTIVTKRAGLRMDDPLINQRGADSKVKAGGEKSRGLTGVGLDF